MTRSCPYLILFRGDDTDFSLNKAIRFTMTDSGFDLTGMTLHFFLLGIDKEFTDFSPERSCELTFSAEETKQFPVGTSLATLYLVDCNGEKHTLTTTLPVRVTLDANEAYLNVDVPVCFPMFNIGTCNINKLCCDLENEADKSDIEAALDEKADKTALEAEVNRAQEVEADLYEAISIKQDALTAEQLAAVNSGINSSLVTKLNGIEAGAEKNPDLTPYAKKSEVEEALADKVGTEALREYAKTVDTMPRYPFVDAVLTDGVVTVAPYTNAKLVSDGAAFTVAVGGDSSRTRDCQLTLDCTDLTTAPTITWPANFHPRTDAETDFACVAGKRNVYWITEYAPNEFCVAGWQQTEGGGTSGGVS